MTVTRDDIAAQVRASLPDPRTTDGVGIDVDAVTDEIMTSHGMIDVDSIDADQYWEIVQRHDSTQV